MAWEKGLPSDTTSRPENNYGFYNMCVYIYSFIFLFFSSREDLLASYASDDGGIVRESNGRGFGHESGLA